VLVIDPAGRVAQTRSMTIQGAPSITIQINGQTATIPVTNEDVVELVEDLRDGRIDDTPPGTAPSLDSAVAAYERNRAADALAQALFFSQLAPQGAPGMPQTPGMPQVPGAPEMPYYMPPAPPINFDPSMLQDMYFDPSWLAPMEQQGVPGAASVPLPPGLEDLNLEDLGLDPAWVPAPPTGPTTTNANPSPITRGDVQEHLDALTFGLNAVQGDNENDFDFGVNWGPFTDDKERFDNLVADLRGNPTMDNYEAVMDFVREHPDTFSDQSMRMLGELQGVVQFLEANRGAVVDEDINVTDGINRSEHALAEEEVRDTVRFLRDDDNHSLSDAGNWGPFTSDKESWDNHLKDMQNAIDDGNLDEAMEHYNWLRERAEGSDNIPSATRDRIVALEQYIPIAAAAAE
jgi:hypothetical protein